MMIRKKNSKPFGTGCKFAMVVGETINEFSGKEAYIIENGMVVDKHRCKIIDNPNKKTLVTTEDLQNIEKARRELMDLDFVNMKEVRKFANLVKKVTFSCYNPQK